jgi:hypothetical protein
LNKYENVSHPSFARIYLTRYPGFLEAIQSVNPPGRWKVLVVDDHSKRLLSAVLKDNDVLQENVTRKQRVLSAKRLLDICLFQ